MERVSGVNNWKLVIRREAAGVVILWAATCDGKAALPDELFARLEASYESLRKILWN